VAVLSDQPISSIDIPTTPKAFATVKEAEAAIGRLRTSLYPDRIAQRSADLPRMQPPLRSTAIKPRDIGGPAIVVLKRGVADGRFRWSGVATR
jgi:hypothetical protein